MRPPLEAGRISYSPLPNKLQEFSRHERMDPAFAHEITIYKRNQKLERKARRRSPLQRSLEAVDTISGKSVNGFFRSLDVIRTHTPGAIPLFPWEKRYFEDHPEAGNPKKRSTWKKLKEPSELHEDGIDSRTIFILDLMKRYAISEETYLSLADQSPTKDTRNSWLFLNKRTYRIFNEWVDHEWPTVISKGIAKGLTTIIPQHPDIDGFLLLGAAAAENKIGTDQGARRDKTQNAIYRLGGEFSLLLRFHYLSLQRSLASFKEFSNNEITDISQRLFQGSRYHIESTMAKREAKTIIAGVGIAQALQDSATGSLSSALINLIGPIAAAVYLASRIRRETSGETVHHYIDMQTQIFQEADLVNKTASSKRGRGISLDLEGTGIPNANDELVSYLSEHQKKINSPLEQTPLWLAGFSQALNKIQDGKLHQFAPGASSLLIGGAIVLAFSKYVDEFTRQRNAEVKSREIERIINMITAIDMSGHKVPRYIDLADAGAMVSFEQAREQMQGPMVIEQLDSGSEQAVSVEEPINLPPGISIVRAPVGGGKSTLLRMLALEQGNLQTTRINKGIDFTKIDPAALSELVYYVEASYQPSSFTIAEQMIPFIIDKDTTFYEAIMNQQHNEGPRLIDKYGRGMLDQFYATFEQRPDLLLGWVDNPRGNANSAESEIASTILTRAFFDLLGPHFAGIRTVEDAADYLLRKPGASQGSSTGEAQKLELLKAFMKKGRKVILLDEPTANLEDEHGNGVHTPNSSVNMVINLIKEYSLHSPDTVIVIASNDSRLDAFLKFYVPELLRQEVTCKDSSEGVHNRNIVWQAQQMKSGKYDTFEDQLR